jgi:hypothetical protein
MFFNELKNKAEKMRCYYMDLSISCVGLEKQHLTSVIEIKAV